MLGEKQRHFKTFPAISLEALVPPENFYRQVEAKLDLRFVRELVAECYTAIGRPSIDPVVFFKLHLIMFFEGIRSERQLMETVNLNLAYRWYIGYDLDEAVPDHSSLSKIRDRYGLEVFQRFFERIIELCQQAGLVWGKELYFDGTKVQANAAMGRLEPRLEVVQQHLEELFPQLPPPVRAPNPRRLIDKYDGTRLLSGAPTNSYHRIADQTHNPTDPSSTPMRTTRSKPAALGYHTHYVVDGGKARIILAALVTPASIMENTPMLDLTRWVCFRWQLFPAIAVGDTTFGTVTNITGLEQDGIRAYLPVTDFSQRTGLYPPRLFHYDAERNVFVCPQGQDLVFHTHSYSTHEWLYKADAALCNACPAKAKCTTGHTGRSLRRSFFHEYLERAARYRQMEAYRKALRKRHVWVEPLFGEGKQWHGMQRFRLRGLEKVNIEGLMRAAGQNIKRLLKANRWQKPHKPAGSAALPPAFLSSFSRP